MSTAIIGVGNIGPTIARRLVDGGESVVLAASETSDVFAEQLGELASAASVPEAIDAGDAVIFAVWFDVAKKHRGSTPCEHGGADAAIRIEMYGDLHEFGGLGGLVDVAAARIAVTAPASEL